MYIFEGNLLDSDRGHRETFTTWQDQVRQRFYVVFQGNLLINDPGHQETNTHYTWQDQVSERFYVVSETIFTYQD